MDEPSTARRNASPRFGASPCAVHLRFAFERLRDRVGVGNVGLHDLRHGVATELLAAATEAALGATGGDGGSEG